MEIKFIINCYNQEEYWPYLKYIIESYKKIKPTYKLVYNGNQPDFSADVRIQNAGHGFGDYELIKAGYNALKDDLGFRWIKLGVDTWLLDEDKIIEIFNKMEEKQCGYAGVWWNDWPGCQNTHPHVYHSDLSMDVIPADTRFGNVFEMMMTESLDTPGHVEHWLKRMLEKHNIKYHIIEERYPICEGRTEEHTRRWNESITENRFLCPKLSWCGSHILDVNIRFLRNWAWNNNRDDILEFIKANGK